MIRKFLYIVIIGLFVQVSSVNAGTEGSEELKNSNNQNTASECFEGFSRAMFKFNHALDGAVFEPVAKGYRSLPAGLRKGTGNLLPACFVSLVYNSCAYLIHMHQLHIQMYNFLL